jgi:hypothetical protein
MSWLAQGIEVLGPQRDRDEQHREDGMVIADASQMRRMQYPHSPPVMWCSITSPSDPQRDSEDEEIRKEI